MQLVPCSCYPLNSMIHPTSHIYYLIIKERGKLSFEAGHVKNELELFEQSHTMGN